jgi:hypothetical protein
MQSTMPLNAWVYIASFAGRYVGKVVSNDVPGRVTLTQSAMVSYHQVPVKGALGQVKVEVQTSYEAVVPWHQPFGDEKVTLEMNDVMWTALDSAEIDRIRRQVLGLPALDDS